MALFENPTEANLRVCAQMVEDVLGRRGVDLEKSRFDGAAGPGWKLRQGSAQLMVLLARGDGGPNTIQVMAPVLRATPAALAGDRLPRRLLELNATTLTQAAFGLRGDDVILTTDRSTTGLDPVEVEEMIRRVADYADHYDDALVGEFGGQRHSDL